MGGLLLLLCLRNSLASQQHWGKLGLWRSLVRRQEIQRGGEPGPVGRKCRARGGGESKRGRGLLPAPPAKRSGGGEGGGGSCGGALGACVCLRCSFSPVMRSCLEKPPPTSESQPRNAKNAERPLRLQGWRRRGLHSGLSLLSSPSRRAFNCDTRKARAPQKVAGRARESTRDAFAARLLFSIPPPPR